MVRESEFEKGWRVLVQIPGREGVQVGTVGDAGTRRVDKRRGLWVWVRVEAKWFLVPEATIYPKKDEPYYKGKLEELGTATLVEARGRERLMMPDGTGYLRALDNRSWYLGGTPVKSRVLTDILNDTYAMLAGNARAANA